MTLILAGPRERVLLMLHRARLLQTLGVNNVHLTMVDAARRAHEVLSAFNASNV